MNTIKKLNRKTHPFLKGILLTAFAAGSINATAQDTIHFTWKGSTSGKYISIYFTYGELFTIDWGDDTVNTYTGNVYPSHTYADTNDYAVTIAANTANGQFIGLFCDGRQLSSLDVSKCEALAQLECYGNQLTSLNVTGCTALEILNCRYNQLDSLVISNNESLRGLLLACNGNQLIHLDVSNNKYPILTYLGCSENRLLLSDLYAASQKMITYPYGNGGKCIGIQRLISRTVAVGDTVDFSSQAEFGGVTTAFKIEKNTIGGIPAVVNIDYTIDSGIIVFNNAGNYVITMTNGTVRSFDEMLFGACHPDEVRAEITVIGASKNALLDTLILSVGELTPVFDKFALNYTVDVGDSITSATITAIPNDTNATVSGDIGTQQLIVGENLFTVTVTAENNITKLNYSVTINREDTATNNVIEITQKNIRIYPNPTTGQIQITNHKTIAHRSERSEESVAVYDVVGQVVFMSAMSSMSTETVIDISHLPAGFYIMKIKTKENIITQKIIKY